MTDTQSITLTKKTTYKQNWPKYDAAQATEKNRLQVLLHDLCKNQVPNRTNRLPFQEREIWRENGDGVGMGTQRV